MNEPHRAQSILQIIGSASLVAATLLTCASPAAAELRKARNAHRWVNKGDRPANDFHFRMTTYQGNSYHLLRAHFLNDTTPPELFLPSQDFGPAGATQWDSGISTATPISPGAAITIVEEPRETPDSHMDPTRSYFTHNGDSMKTVRHRVEMSYDEILKSFGISHVGVPGDESYQLTAITAQKNASASGLSLPGLFQPSDGTIVYSQAGPLTLAPGGSLTIPVGDVIPGTACVLDFQSAESATPGDMGPMQYAFEQGPASTTALPTDRTVGLALGLGLALLGVLFVRRSRVERAAS